MSSSTDPENLPPRHAREDDNRSGSYRAADADSQSTRSFEQVPASSAGPASTYSERPAAYAERDYTPTAATPAVNPNLTDRETAVAREKEQFGGIKVGSAFFGWLTATGMAVLLTALVAAAGTAVGLANNTDVNEAVNHLTRARGTEDFMS